jgi:uncharacterized protein
VNRLAAETSPYLLQHRDNPVDWRPWGDEAFAEARLRDVPVLLSVGYSACHWCHVMEHESFSDPHTAELMNRMFVNVKVDREERPDVDAVYMDAVVSMTGHGGWPLTVFVTPDGRPFYGGTYFPPEPRHGLPSFRQLLAAIEESWRARRDDVAAFAERMTATLAESADREPSSLMPSDELMDQAVDRLGELYDPRWGGFGAAPKFPPGPLIGFLLRHHVRTGRGQALEMAVGTLDGMAAGGMYDVLGGGFHRYSVDQRWLVPHFEKMLYDNALLATAYIEAYAVTGEPRHRAVAEATVDYMLRELRLPDGGLASSQDADTLGEEGATFVWTPAELRRALGDAAGAAAIEYYGITDDGNFEGASILRPTSELTPQIIEINRKLLEIREKRAQPGRDDKVVAGWNGLALAAMAQVGQRLGRTDVLEAARALAEFLHERMSDGQGRLLRTYRAGRAHIPGYLEDHAAVAHGLLELHRFTGEPEYLRRAESIVQVTVERFGDPLRGGFFFSASDGEPMIAKRKEFDDNPTPSGNSLMASVLARLGRLDGDAERERLAERVLGLTVEQLARMPHAFGQMLSVADLLLAVPREVAVVGALADPATRELADAALEGFNPTTVYAFGPGDEAWPALLAGREPVDGRPAVFICERFACRLPFTDPDQVRQALAG